MSGTVAGGIKTREANKLRHGSDFYAKIGRLGGTASRGHQFAHGKVDPRVAGRKGGRKSKRVSQAMEYEAGDYKQQAKDFLSRIKLGRFIR